MKTLLRNGRIYDGSGAEAFEGDILLEDEKILRVGRNLDPNQAERVVELKGLCVAPGFIDAHSHNDWFALRKERLPYFAPFIRQGITTFVTGNCGISATGFEPETPHLDKLGGGLFSFRDTTGVYGSVGDYLRAVDKAVPCNLAVLAGHCTARASASGKAPRKLTEEETNAMLATLEEALKQGAAGISLGLMYEPGLYADTDELKQVAALCLKYDRPLTVHPRASSAVSMSYPQLLGRSHLLRALDELVEVVGETKLKLQYSHAIFVGRRSFRDKDEFVRIIRSLREKGADVQFDIYNELLGVSVITVILPAWYQSMTREERRKPLNRLKLSVLVKASSLLLGFGFRDIQVAYIGPGYEAYEGMTVHEIARMEGLSDLEAYLMLCEKSDFKGRVNMGPYSTPEIIRDFSHDDNCLYMTDAWVEEKGVQNPAIYDCFPKFLRDSLLGVGDTMEKTIRKMTGATADRFKLEGRGYIREGCCADLTIFDEEALKAAVPDEGKPFGIRMVYINGRKVLEDGTLDEQALSDSGRAIPVLGS